MPPTRAEGPEVTVDDLVVDLAGDLSRLARPVTGQVLFGHPEPAPPATIG